MECEAVRLSRSCRLFSCVLGSGWTAGHNVLLSSFFGLLPFPSSGFSIYQGERHHHHSRDSSRLYGRILAILTGSSWPQLTTWVSSHASSHPLPSSTAPAPEYCRNPRAFLRSLYTYLVTVSPLLEPSPLTSGRFAPPLPAARHHLLARDPRPLRRPRSRLLHGRLRLGVRRPPPESRRHRQQQQQQRALLPTAAGLFDRPCVSHEIQKQQR